MLHVRSKNLDISPPWSSNLPESVENAGWKDEQAKFKIELWDSDLQWLHIPGGICPLYYVTMVVLNSFVGLVAIIHVSCCLAYYGFWFSLQALTSDYSDIFCDYDVFELNPTTHSCSSLCVDRRTHRRSRWGQTPQTLQLPISELSCTVDLEGHEGPGIDY